MNLQNIDEVARLVIETGPLLMRNFRVDLRLQGMAVDPSHFRVLMMLAKRSFNLRELAEHQAVTEASMSNTITTLVQRGWVQRIPSEQDRRMVVLGLSPAGSDLLESIHHQLCNRMVEQLGAFTPEELAQLQTGLLLLRRMLQPGSQDAVKPSCDVLFEPPAVTASTHEPIEGV